MGPRPLRRGYTSTSGSCCGAGRWKGGVGSVHGGVRSGGIAAARKACICWSAAVVVSGGAIGGGGANAAAEAAAVEATEAAARGCAAAGAAEDVEPPAISCTFRASCILCITFVTPQQAGHLCQNRDLLVVTSCKRVEQLGRLQQIRSVFIPCKQFIRHICIHRVFFSCLFVTCYSWFFRCCPTAILCQGVMLLKHTAGGVHTLVHKMGLCKFSAGRTLNKAMAAVMQVVIAGDSRSEAFRPPLLLSHRKAWTWLAMSAPKAAPCCSSTARKRP
jgi:hypothetical protein